MIFRNFTPFPHLIFESRDEQRRDFGVLVLRGSFEIAPGEPLRPLSEQQPLVMADQYHGEPGTSSLRMENNLAPYKPKSDVHVEAMAMAPGGVASASWLVGIDVGTTVSKRILVTGPRAWTKSATGWTLSEIMPVKEVPLTYEHAYGGTVQTGDTVDTLPQNPVGVGWVNAERKRADMIPCPQLLPPNLPIPPFDKAIPVEGLGPLAPGWQPRLAHAGTFDALWQKSRWPDLPEDFRFDFYNSAHPDLVFPGFLKGDELIRLHNLTPEGLCEFRLPAYQVAMLFRFEDGQIVPGPLNLDSVHLNVPKRQVYLTWRGIYPLSKPMRVLEARLRVAPGTPAN